MTDNRQIMDELDACRPDRDGTNEPELARLANQLPTDPSVRATLDRSRRLDANIRRALHAVSVPAGLGDRILQRLAAAGVKSAEQSATPVELHPSHAAPTVPARSSRVTRRTWLSAAAIAASLALAAGIWMLSPAPEEILTPDLIAERSQDWQRRLDESSHVRWNNDLAAVQREWRMISDRFRFRPTGWIDASSFTETAATAYQFKVDRATATLFVLDASGIDVSQFPDYPPAEAVAGSWGNNAVASWSSGAELFVLVMDDAAMYPKLVDRTPPILAMQQAPRGRSAIALVTTRPTPMLSHRA